ncbi:hypothetical protein JL722_7511 [Aureococcus anophagefferens]|nr:hypothetical protein JL722_7511 [Aureococcus anophagefferens]
MSSKSSKHALLGPSIANFSVQYNFQVIAIALAIAQRDMPQETWVKTQDKSVIFIGCILGQFLMGYAGDLIGRTKALSLTLSLAVLGAVGSSLGPWGDITDVYTTIIAFRFVIGFGLGGVYPLSATKAAEAESGDAAASTEAEKRADAIARSSSAFFWQGPGMCAPYLLAVVLRASLKSQQQGFQWRFLLGAGALPALAVVLMSDATSDAPATGAAATNASLRDALRDAKVWKQFAGTGGGWFLYDIAFYGFDGGVPAMLATVWALNRKLCGVKRMQVFGFYLMAASYLLYIVLALGREPWVLYGCYCLLNFTLNFGPNVTTFVLPSATYPREMRSSMNGLSSAAGKLGAVLGTELLPTLELSYNLNVVLFFCMATCVAGALTSWAVDDDEPDAPRRTRASRRRSSPTPTRPKPPHFVPLAPAG